MDKHSAKATQETAILWLLTTYRDLFPKESTTMFA